MGKTSLMNLLIPLQKGKRIYIQVIHMLVKGMRLPKMNGINVRVFGLVVDQRFCLAFLLLENLMILHVVKR